MSREVLETIAKVHEIFIRKGLTLSVAESCTGGLISHYLTTLPGASRFFVAGVVAYSTGSKKKILGIPSRTLSAFGLVSEGTAKRMAERIREITEADYALSTTGNLGPDVLEGKERGLVYIAISSKRKTAVKELRLKGEREEVKEEAAVSALRFLIEAAIPASENPYHA